MYLGLEIDAGVNTFGDGVAQHWNVDLPEVIDIAGEVVGDHAPSDGGDNVPDRRLHLRLFDGLHIICVFFRQV